MHHTRHQLLVNFSEASRLTGESMLIWNAINIFNQTSASFYQIKQDTNEKAGVLILLIEPNISKLFNHHKSFLLLFYYPSRSSRLLDKLLLLFVDVALDLQIILLSSLLLESCKLLSFIADVAVQYCSVVCGLLFLLLAFRASSTSIKHHQNFSNIIEFNLHFISTSFLPSHSTFVYFNNFPNGSIVVIMQIIISWFVEGNHLFHLTHLTP